MPAMTPSLVILLGVTFLRCTHYSYAQTTVVGPSDTVYVNPGESASFNCSVTQWRTGDLASVFWGKSRDYGVTWTNVAQCFDAGTCLHMIGFEDVYFFESNAPDYNFFKLTVTSATLDEDAHYDCYSFEDSSVAPPSPHGRLYVLNQVTDVSISGYNNGDTREVGAGTEVITTCTATSGNPPADLLWTIGDKDITSKIDNSTEETGEDTRLYDTTSSLRYPFNASDDQQYLKCQSFQHDSLTPRSSQILMDVKHAPVIQAIVVDSWEGNTVVVECLATANPNDVTYYWVSDDGQTGGNSRTWTLTDQDGDDEVTVTCNASNVKGETSLTEIVKIPYVPTVISTTDNPYMAKEGDKVELSCETDADPPFSDGIIWEWLEKGQGGFVPVNTSSDIYEITPESGGEQETTLTISSVQIIHANTYVCKLGESAVNISVTVTDVPTVDIPTENLYTVTPQHPCECSNTLSIVFGCLFAMTLALLILIFSLLFINGHGLRVLVKKKDRKSENSPESTYQGLQRDFQQSSYTHLHIGNTNVPESPEYIDLDMGSMYASLEEDNKSKDNVYFKSGDVVREFPRSRLYVKDILCEGRFSKTMTGEAWFIGGKDGVSDVIVKVDKGDKTDFKREVEVMGSLSKLKGVVEYLGCCITEDPLYLITEYAPTALCFKF